jgi:hypothetical protein
MGRTDRRTTSLNNVVVRNTNCLVSDLLAALLLTESTAVKVLVYIHTEDNLQHPPSPCKAPPSLGKEMLERAKQDRARRTCGTFPQKQQLTNGKEASPSKQHVICVGFVRLSVSGQKQPQESLLVIALLRRLPSASDRRGWESSKVL